MKLKPMGERLLVEVIVQEKVSAGGIVLPNSGRSGVVEGIVRARPGGNGLVAEELKVGAKVVFAREAAVRVGEGAMCILDAEHVLAVYEGG